MNRFLSRIVISALIISVAAAVFAGCGKKVSDGSDTIKIMFSGQEPAGWDKVLEEYNKTGAKDTGVRINVEWIPAEDYKEKLNLRMVGAENYDLVFDAPFNKLRTFASYGMYVPLEEYIESGDYPNLKSAFPKEIMDANYYFGHLYGLPMMRTYGNGIDCIYYRKDLAKKYNIGNNGQINSYEDLQKFFEAILSNSEVLQNMVPLGVSNERGFFTMFAQDEVDFAENHIVRMSLGGIFAHILLNETNSEVKDIVFEGEDTAKYSEYPEKYRDGELLGMSRLKTIREWNKYLEKDSLGRADTWSMFTGFECAAIVDNLDGYEQKIKELAAAAPEAELGVFIHNDGVRNMEPAARLTDLKSNNFICIPAWSKKIDKVLTFLDWIYEKPENHDLFELGIEGVNWNAVGEEKYEQIIPADGELYSFPGYMLTWNPKFVRLTESLPEDIYNYKKYDLNFESYYESPLAGFTFDTSDIQTECTIVSGLVSSVRTALEHGVLDDPVGVKRRNTEECLTNGLDTIREEAKKQINEFLENKHRK